jgi:hypothetical protein
MSAIHPEETNGGVLTSWLPLTAAWPASQPCFSSFLADGDFATGAIAYLFDPTYGVSC